MDVLVDFVGSPLLQGTQFRGWCVLVMVLQLLLFLCLTSYMCFHYDTWSTGSQVLGCFDERSAKLKGLSLFMRFWAALFSSRLMDEREECAKRRQKYSKMFVEFAIPALSYDRTPELRSSQPLVYCMTVTNVFFDLSEMPVERSPCLIWVKLHCCGRWTSYAVISFSRFVTTMRYVP